MDSKVSRKKEYNRINKGYNDGINRLYLCTRKWKYNDKI